MTSSVMERVDTYLEGVTAETFSLDEYLLGIDDRLLATPAGRRALTELDPLLFALVYLPHHLLINGEITFSDFHLDAFREARRWIVMATEPAQDRDAYIAPRESGKSTMFFLLLPMWAAAFLHRRFAAAFADSASQAQKHLKTFKLELENNQALRCDFPLLCAPALRPRGQTVSDSQGLLVSKSGFAFGAAGLDSSSLGMKIGAQRPDLIVLDDIEPDESNYSPYLKQKRLATIRQSIFPLNIYARIVMVGTTTMFGSVMHDIVRAARGDRDVPEWVAEEKVRGHYYGAIVADPVTGVERSLWPAKWSLRYLLSIRHTRQYRLNYENDPLGRDGDFWRIEDIAYGTTPAFTGQLLSIDPAVTSKERSDYTALSVIAYYAPERKVVVRDAWALRIPPGELLRARVLSILEEYPDIAGVLVESNQAGEAWRAILHDIPVRIHLIHQSAPKEVRAAKLLNHYQRGRVLHEKRIPELEGQLVSFPKGQNDDLVDSVGTGVAVFLDKPKKRTGGGTRSYV